MSKCLAKFVLNAKSLSELKPPTKLGGTHPKPYKGVLPAFGPTQWVPQLAQEVEVNCTPPLFGTVEKVDLQRRLAWVWNDVEGECRYGFEELRPARQKRK